MDASITTKDKYAVVFNMYATRGDLVLDLANRPTSLPGTSARLLHKSYT